jgi:hypothetical protein
MDPGDVLHSTIRRATDEPPRRRFIEAKGDHELFEYLTRELAVIRVE